MALPQWVREIVAPGDGFASSAGALGASVDLAVASARRGGGPFGAVVADRADRAVGVGWNRVIPAGDSTAHAEVLALRAAQERLATHDLAQAPGAPFSLYSSCAPCIMCFGAIYWSGLSRVVAAATAAHAAALGFDEGPMTHRLWEAARQRKGITYEPEADAGRDPNAPFEAYRQVGGQIY